MKNSFTSAHCIKKILGGVFLLLFCACGTETTQTFTVNFDTNGGTTVACQTIEIGQKVTEPTNLTKDGYTFAGWYADAEFGSAFDFDTAITSDTTIYAKWAGLVTVRFSTHDVDFGIPAQEIASGGKATKPADPTSEYLPHFEGWYKDEDLTQPFDFETPIIGSITLYAKWQLEGTRFVMMWVRSEFYGYAPIFEIVVAEDRLLGMGPSSYAFAESLGYTRGGSLEIFILDGLQTDINVGEYRWSGAKVPDDGVLDGWVPGPGRKVRGDDSTIITEMVLQAAYSPDDPQTIGYWGSKVLLTKKLVAGKITLNAGFDVRTMWMSLWLFSPDNDAAEVRYIPVRGAITTAN